MGGDGLGQAPMRSADGVYLCRDCKLPLVEEGAFGWGRSFGQVLLHALIGAAIMAAVAPVFFLARMMMLGGFSGADAGGIIVLIASKVGIGIVLGFMAGALTGVFGPDTGLALGAVLGVLGAFFMAANGYAPISADPAARWDVVVTSVSGGVILAGLALVVDWLAMTRYRRFMVMEPGSEK